VFEGSVDGDTIHAERVLCKNVLGDAEPERDLTIIQTGQTTKAGNFSLGAGLADNLIPGVDLKADLARLDKSHTLEVNAKQAAYSYYTLERQLEAQPARSCLNAIDILKQRGQFNNRVFVIPAVYEVQGVSYKFDKSTDVGGEIKASIAKVGEAAAKAGYNSNIKGAGTPVEDWITLRVAQPLFIKDWDVSGAIGVEREVTITTEAAPSIAKGVDASKMEE
jgi:hypothetical protein